MKYLIALTLAFLSLTAKAELYSCKTELNEEVALYDDLNVDAFNPVSDEGERLTCVKAQKDLLEEVTYRRASRHPHPSHRVVHRSCWPDGTMCRGQDCYDQCCHSSGGYTSLFVYNCG